MDKRHIIKFKPFKYYDYLNGANLVGSERYP